MTSVSSGVLSWRSFHTDPCPWGSLVCQSCSHRSVGPAAKLMCMVSAKASPGSCSSCTGVWSAEGCLSPCQNYPDKGLCWKFRAHLAHYCHGQTIQEKTWSCINLRKVMWDDLVSCSWTWLGKCMSYMGFPGQPWPGTAHSKGKNMYTEGRQYERKPSDFPFCYSVFILLQYVSTHTVQITGHLCAEGISMLCSTTLYKAEVLLLLPMQESQSLKYNGLMLIWLCFGLQQLCQSFQSTALRGFPDIWADLV